MEKRIVIVAGHYGSGKTEFAINYCMKKRNKYEKAALIDLDVANTYFRSRERQGMLESAGVAVYSNAFGYDITAELPAIAASARTPLENNDTLAVVDAGGNDSGARVLNQFRKYFGEEAALFIVVNANRPETNTPGGAAEHILAIRAETGIEIGGIVNNTHMLHETRCEDVMKGYELCKPLSENFKVPLVYNCCREDLCAELEKESTKRGYGLDIFPLTIYMRQPWMNKTCVY